MELIMSNDSPLVSTSNLNHVISRTKLIYNCDETQHSEASAPSTRSDRCHNALIHRTGLKYSDPCVGDMIP